MNKQWLIAVLIDWTIIVSAFVLAHCYYWLIPLAMLIIGNRQHALGILGHDGAHQLVIPRLRFCNDLLTDIFTFWPLGLNLKEYRKFHWDHHRNTNNDRDPEILLKKTLPNHITGPVTIRKVLLHGVMDLLGFGIPHIVRFLFYTRPRTIAGLIPIVVLDAVAIALLFTSLFMVPLLWFGSLLTSFWFFFRLRVWTEHVGLGVGKTLRFSPTWWQIALFLPHNTWLHYEHHAEPSVPFNRLRQMRTEVFTSLREIMLGKGQ